VDVVEQHEAENLADTGHGLQQIQGRASWCLAVCKRASARAWSSSS
jgi:hypothetical protein